MLTNVAMSDPLFFLISAMVHLPSLSWLVLVISYLSLNFNMQTPLLL